MTVYNEKKRVKCIWSLIRLLQHFHWSTSYEGYRYLKKYNIQMQVDSLSVLPAYSRAWICALRDATSDPPRLVDALWARLL